MPTKILLVFLFIISLTLTPKCWGNSLNNNVQLSLTPLACFVKKNGDVCNITVKVTWQSKTPIDACLYQNNDKVDCWQATQQASKKITVSLSENMRFTLQGNKVIYAQQEVTVAATTSAKYRRRLRAGWSLF